MSGNRKGNVLIASVILAVALFACTLVMTLSLKKFQNNVFAFVEMQKQDAINRLRVQKQDVISMLRAQKREMKRFARDRESRGKNFVRNELKDANIDIKKAGQ